MKVEMTKKFLSEFFADVDGELVWRKQHSGRKAGSKAGSVDGYGYLRVLLFGRAIRNHRILWVLRNGEIPDGMEIDHRDQNKLNNADGNLRLASHMQNMQNKSLRLDNTSGEPGVTWDKHFNRWRVRVSCAGKSHYGGLFVGFEDAVRRVRELRDKLHGEYAA